MDKINPAVICLVAWFAALGAAIDARTNLCLWGLFTGLTLPVTGDFIGPLLIQLHRLIRGR